MPCMYKYVAAPFNGDSGQMVNRAIIGVLARGAQLRAIGYSFLLEKKSDSWNCGKNVVNAEHQFRAKSLAHSPHNTQGSSTKRKGVVHKYCEGRLQYQCIGKYSR